MSLTLKTRKALAKLPLQARLEGLEMVLAWHIASLIRQYVDADEHYKLGELAVLRAARLAVSQSSIAECEKRNALADAIGESATRSARPDRARSARKTRRTGASARPRAAHPAKGGRR